VSDKRFRGTYRIAFAASNEPGWTAEEANESGLGVCDAIVALPISLPTTGQSRQIMISHNGQTGKDLTPDELFRVWFVMTASLMQLPVKPLFRMILRMVISCAENVGGFDRSSTPKAVEYDKVANATTDPKKGTN